MKASRMAVVGGVVLLACMLLAVGSVLLAQAEGATTQTEKVIPVYTLRPTSPPGTYWSLQHLNEKVPYPPLPMNPFPELLVETLDASNHVFLLLDESVDYEGLRQQLQIESALLQFLGLEEMDEESGGGGSYGALCYTSDDLWLEIVLKTNTTGFFVIHPPEVEATNGVYDLYLTTNLSVTVPGLNGTNWQWVLRCDPGQTNLVVTNLTADQCFFMLGRTNDADGDGLSTASERLVSHSDPEDWDSDGDGLSDGWEWNHFGNFDPTAGGDYDSDGFNNGLEYTNVTDPNTIAFWLTVANAYVTTDSVWIQLNVTGGVPASMAVLVNNTNLASANWQSYTTSNPLVSLGSTDGDYEVRIGLRGQLTTSQQTWHDITITRDTVPPVIVITDPLAATNTQPLIQLLGYGSEPLSTVSFDLTNAVGLVTNQVGFVIFQDYSTNSFKFTTNYFQCFDIFLTNGANTITVRATDLAGNSATTNRTYTLNSDAIAPALSLTWPQNGTKVSGDNFTLAGSMDDPSAKITATLVSTNGVTNVLSGIVGRSGRFRVENVPHDVGTNQLELTATDAWGNSATTNIAVIKSSLTLTIDPLTTAQLQELTATVTGTVSDTNLDVWVGGIQAVVNEEGTWQAADVPVSHEGRNSIFAKAIPIGGNPNSPGTVESHATQETPPVIQVVGYHHSASGSTTGFAGFGRYSVTESRSELAWAEEVGGSYRLDTHRIEYWTGTVPPLVYFDYGECTESATLPLELGQAYQTVNSCGGTTVSALSFPMKHAIVATADFGSQTDAQTAVKPGGDDTPGSVNIYGAKLWVYDQFNNPIAPSRVRMQGRTLVASADDPNANEILVAAPPGAASIQPMTPQVPGEPSISWSAQVEDIKLSITANGITLDPNIVVTNAEFIVGQMITFSTNWSSLSQANQSEIVNRQAQWTFEGTFKNHSTNAVPGGSWPNSSDVPYVNANLLAREVVTNWWVSGGTNPPATYTARLTETLTLSNGSVVVKSGKGMFTMLRPLPWFYPAVRDTVRVGTNFGINGVLQPGYRLQFGVNTPGPAHVDVGIAFVYTNAPINPLTLETYGRYFIAQVIERYVQRYNVRNGSNCAGTQVIGENGLDGGYPYNNEFKDGVSGEWIDSPGGGLTYASWLTMTNSFTAFLMFQPKPYTNSVAVPMYQVVWEWSGTARTNGPPNSWVLVSGSPPVNPQSVEATNFPAWTHIIAGEADLTTTTNLTCFDEN